MTDEKRKHQGNGSNEEWVRGDVGETLNHLERNPDSQHRDFYESRRESEESAPDQGGRVSRQQIAENRERAGLAIDEGASTQKVSVEESGAKRDSYFKTRDYE